MVALLPHMICGVAALSVHLTYWIVQLTLFSKQIDDAPLPPDTELLEKENRVGNFSNNGNGLIYVAAGLLRSGLSLEELQIYYNSLTFAPAQAGSPYSFAYCYVKSLYFAMPMGLWQGLSTKR